MTKEKIIKLIISRYNLGYYSLMEVAINEYKGGLHKFFIDLHEYLINESNYVDPFKKYTDISTEYHMMQEVYS